MAIEDTLSERFGNRLEAIEKDLEWAKSQYEEKRDNAAERLSEPDEDVLKKYALRAVAKEINKLENGQGNEVRILSLGYEDPRSFGDNDVMIARGLLLGVEDDDRDESAGKCSVLLREEHVDWTEMRNTWQPNTVVKAEMSLQTADNVAGAYKLETTETTLEWETEEPITEDELALVEEHVDEAVIADMGEHLSLTDDNGYAADFGADFKRVEAFVAEVGGGENAAYYTLQDDSIVDIADVPESVKQENELGLGCWISNDFKEYGEDSLCTFYGVITTNQDGSVVMNGFGVDPEIPVPYEGDDNSGSSGNNGGSSGGDSGGSDMETRTI